MSKSEVLELKPELVPNELKVFKRWMMWKALPNEKEPGKFSKPPHNERGFKASKNDAKNYLSFDKAVDLYRSQRDKFDGIGLVLPPEIVAVDLDRCISEGGWNNDLMLINELLETYGEFSPSGNGAHFFCSTKCDDSLTATRHDLGIEIYHGKAADYFITITGQRIDDRYVKAAGHPQGIRTVHGMAKKFLSPFEIQENPESREEAIKYLDALTEEYADDRDLWIKVGMALKHTEDSEEMYQIWDEWSAQSPKYLYDDDTRYTWNSFTRKDGNLITLSWLKYHAINKCGFKERAFQPSRISAAELLRREIKTEYLIKGVLAANELMVIGGPEKSLKTTIGLDMAVSLATGTPFLGQFQTDGQRRNVYYVSGELGEARTKSVVEQIKESKGISANQELEKLDIGFDLPLLNDPRHVEDLIDDLRAHDTEVLFLDPLYLSLDAGDQASNIFAMGKMLRPVRDKIERAGITVILLHHFRKQGETYDRAPKLEELSQAGTSQITRQWLLLKHRNEYRSDGSHSLWFINGGSSGHGNRFVLEAFTGTEECGLSWKTTLVPESEWKDLQNEKRGTSKS